MVRIITYLIVLCSVIEGVSQSVVTELIPVEQLPDAPQGYVTFMYVRHSTYSDTDLNVPDAESTHNYINAYFTTVKPYIVVFSDQHTPSMVETQTEQLLKKWSFEENYPYNYLLILSNSTIKLILGKHIVPITTDLSQIYFYIKSLWATSNNTAMHNRLYNIIRYLKSLRIQSLTPITNLEKDYLLNWDKQYFFNYNKLLSEKQEKYLNTLLHDIYLKENIRFWVILSSRTKTQSKKFLQKLHQKANFNIQKRQAIIAFYPNSYATPEILLTQDLNSEWSILIQNEIATTAQFYHNKRWYYDMVKETVLRIKEELLYKNTLSRTQEETLRKNEYLQAKNEYRITIEQHKILYWLINAFLLLPIILIKIYLEKASVGKTQDQLRYEKSMVGILYAIVLAIIGLFIVRNTPLFYIKEIANVKILNDVLLYMLIYGAILILLFKKKIIYNSCLLILIISLILYLICLGGNYLYARGEWVSSIAGRSFLYDILYCIILFMAYAAAGRHIDPSGSISPRSSSIRKGFGKRNYVSKYVAK